MLIKLIPPDVQTPISQPAPGRFPSSKSQWKTEHLLRKIQLKNHCSSVLHQYPDSLKLAKKHYYELCLLEPGRLRRHSIFKWLSKENCWFVILASLFWEFEISQKTYFFSFRWILKLVIVSSYKFKFLHHELCLNHNNCTEVFRWKPVDFVRCIGVRIVQNFQKKHHVNNFSGHSNSTSFVTHNYKLRFLYRNLNEKLFSCKTISRVILSILFLALKNLPSDNSNHAIFKASSRFWSS